MYLTLMYLRENERLSRRSRSLFYGMKKGTSSHIDIATFRAEEISTFRAYRLFFPTTKSTEIFYFPFIRSTRKTFISPIEKKVSKKYLFRFEIPQVKRFCTILVVVPVHESSTRVQTTARYSSYTITRDLRLKFCYIAETILLHIFIKIYI